MSIVKLEASWLDEVGAEFEKPYMRTLREFLLAERALGKVIYPKGDEIFNALNSTPIESVKVVILGQDPYHGPNQAHGLSFSVPHGVAVPPSLQNIYKELSRSFNLPVPNHGCLQPWAEQGVLLLNSTLTVQAGMAASHQNKGWETFTDALVAAINNRCESVVFLLWGAYAKKKGRVIDTHRHLVLLSPHPSPLSAHRGFIGNNHFVEANRYLSSKGNEAINWLGSL